MTAQGDASCLVAKLGHYIKLTARDEALLHRLEEQGRDYRRRACVRREGGRIEDLFVVRTGWFYSASTMADGRRQVHHIYVPGDLIGTHEIVCSVSTSGVYAASDGSLCPFEKAGLREIFAESPRLTALLYSIAGLEQIVLDDRLRALGRMTAEGRIAQLLLQLLARLRINDRDTGNRFRLPLTQELLGDATGLTGIHVNRVMQQLKKKGLIVQKDGVIELKDEDALCEIADFDNRYYDIDTSWFPHQAMAV